jgi:hypothetical protein
MTWLSKLESIVSRLLDEVGGGEPYFDKFDELMRHGENLEIVKRLLKVQGHIVASGRFGSYLGELQQQGALQLKANFILVTGGLRKGATAKVEYQRASASGDFTFVDDSYYSGITERQVKSLLESLGAKVTSTRVIYDGSPSKAPHVKALFRYYDNYPRQDAR